MHALSDHSVSLILAFLCSPPLILLAALHSMSAPSPSAPPSMWSSTTAVHPPPYFNKPAFESHGMSYVRLGNTGAVVSRIALGLMSYATQKPEDTKWQEWVLAGEQG